MFQRIFERDPIPPTRLAPRGCSAGAPRLRVLPIDERRRRRRPRRRTRSRYFLFADTDTSIHMSIAAGPIWPCVHRTKSVVDPPLARLSSVYPKRRRRSVGCIRGNSGFRAK
ncbi:hypothetical protein EVAR_22898_1 [Eumeta japonica]|uniref:Uncharacterized protein n=1 Tax=Eumeta variegata TaxID=151549 RepID=A0A4C1UU82_EUMVA|nr:hypothetical protein EVAR_22898_1 [Eumeta japonica]